MLVATLAIVSALSSQAAASSPELHRIDPSGGQRGTTVQATLRGVRLADAAELLFYESGIIATDLTVVDGKTVKVQLKIDPTCATGEHRIRLRSRTGITQLRTFWVGHLPVVPEKEPNSTFDTPQSLNMNVTVQGVVKNEDVDHFVVEAKAGTRITAEIEGMRLGRTMFDPYLAILDHRRFELAASDDSSLHLQDGVASIVAPADGRYVIQVRESSYGGNNTSVYRLHVGTFPRPTVASPPGGPIGAEMAVSLLGDAAGPIDQTVKLATDGQAGVVPILQTDESGTSPSPVQLRAAPFPNAPDDADAEPPVPPVAFNGVLLKPHQRGIHRFTAKKGQQFDINVFARRVRSPLDPVLNVFGPNKKHVKGNDDRNGPDSFLRFKASADGAYELRVRDHLGRGGANFVYRVEVDHIRPALSLAIHLFNSRRFQYLQTAPVPQGNRYAMLVRGDRSNVGGAINLEMATLPNGVTLHTGTMANGVRFTPIVFEASAEAPLGGALCPLAGRIPRKAGDVVGGLRQDVPLVVSDPNQTVYYRTTVDKLAVAVTEPAPFKIDLEPPAVPIVRNGSMRLKVTATRIDGFEGDIEVRMLWNPSGVSSSGSIKIPKGKTEGFYTLNANGKAATRTSKIAVIARSTVGNAERWVSSQLVDLTVTEPFISGSLQMAAAERGQAATVLCKLDQKKPFEGEATIRLLGLPHKAGAMEKKVTKDVKEIVFEVTTAPDTPVGTHKSLFCQATVTQKNAPIVHRMAFGGVLRVDKPKPKKTAPPKQPAKPKAKAAKKQPAKKPLSRLQQLRQAAAEKAKKANKG